MAASVRIAVATINDAIAITGDIVFGRIWVIMILRLLSPSTTAALTKSRLRRLANSDRTRRATGGQLTMPIARMMDRTEGDRIATNNRAKTKVGIV